MDMVLSLVHVTLAIESQGNGENIHALGVR
jgi:hypothetical protein